MAHHTAADRGNLENVTATASPLPSGAHRITNSIDFLTGVPIGFFDHGLPGAITQGEGYQTGISDDIERQIALGTAIQREQMAEEIEDSVKSALDEAGDNPSLVDKLIQSILEAPTSGIRTLNDLLRFVPGAGKLSTGIESLLDAPGLFFGDVIARSPLGRAIDDRVVPVARAGEEFIGSTKDRVSEFGDQFDAVVNPIEMVLRGLKILNDPIGAATDVAFKNNPGARRLIETALEVMPPQMAEGGAVMNYNNPLMMRYGGTTRRRSGRRGGVADLLERQRRARQREESRRNRQIAQARRRQQQRTPAAPPLEQQTRLSDNYAAIEQRLLAEQAARDSRPPHSPTDGLRDAAISRYQKMLDMEEDLAGGPLLGVPTPVTGGEQIRFGPDGQMLPPLTTPNRNKARPEHFQPGGNLYGRQIRRGPPMIVGKRAPSDARANIPAPQRDAFQQIPASQQDALQQMLDLLASNARVLGRR